MKSLHFCFIFALVLLFMVSTAWASKKDCGDPPNMAKPAKQVNKQDPNIQNDYDKIVKEDPKAIYLAVINGSTPKPNACGLNPTNPAGEWTGWGGPLDRDNATIGEGAGSRNEIVIGGTYFERGIGTHAAAKLVYSLTGDSYKKFEAYVGMSDEKDPAECGHGGSCAFIFTIDGKEMEKTPTLKGTDGGKEVEALKVEFNIPSGAKELVIQVTDGGDGNSCDHGALGDAKLLTAAGMSVTKKDKSATLWGSIKAAY
jgi:hypothetical protein